MRTQPRGPIWKGSMEEVLLERNLEAAAGSELIGWGRGWILSTGYWEQGKRPLDLRWRLEGWSAARGSGRW